MTSLNPKDFPIAGSLYQKFRKEEEHEKEVIAR
jgi:hypothetical protein